MGGHDSYSDTHIQKYWNPVVNMRNRVFVLIVHRRVTLHQSQRLAVRNDVMDEVEVAVEAVFLAWRNKTDSYWLTIVSDISPVHSF